MNKKSTTINEGKTYLRSTSHMVLREVKGNRLRSILVGLQFFIYFPYEIITVALWPFVNNILHGFYYLFGNTFFVLKWTMIAVYYGFSGYLEASDEPTIIAVDDDLI